MDTLGETILEIVEKRNARLIAEAIDIIRDDVDAETRDRLDALKADRMDDTVRRAIDADLRRLLAGALRHRSEETTDEDIASTMESLAGELDVEGA